jgi:hypothetical protein
MCISLLFSFSTGGRKETSLQIAFQTKERSPELPTDQGFEGWPLRGVRQPPQRIESGMTMGTFIHGRGSGYNPEVP